MSLPFSTAYRVAHESTSALEELKLLRNDDTSPLFLAVIEATEEAILNSLFAAETTKGFQGHTIEKLPIPKVLEILKKYGKVK